jgi:predicted anti-sigma-YlaC factor YlaD
MSACIQHQHQLASMAGRRNSEPPNPTLTAHLAACPACRELAVDLGIVVRHLETAAGSLTQTSLSPRTERAVARAIRQPQRGGRTNIGWWVALSGAAVLLLLVFENAPRGKRAQALEVLSAVQPSTSAFRSAEAPQLSRYQSAFRHSEESLDALLDGGGWPTPVSLSSETIVALRPTSRIE